MKPLQGFAGFSGMGGMGAAPAPNEEPAPGKGSQVFQQILQQLQASKQAQRTAAKSKVDTLWPMGTAVKGKV